MLLGRPIIAWINSLGIDRYGLHVIAYAVYGLTMAPLFFGGIILVEKLLEIGTADTASVNH